MRVYRLIILLTAVFPLFVGCNNAPDSVEVTRVVNEEIPVTVEVIREVEVEVTVPVEVAVEVPVEVTRIVEVVVTPTAEQATPTGETAATSAAETTPESTGAATNIYTVVDGDSWALIAYKTQTPVAEIRAANNMTKPTRLFAGMELTIPGWDGVALEVGEPETPEAEVASLAGVTVGANLLPNASFEGDWYFYNGVQEWQISEGWKLAIDEGPNPFTDADDRFIRPEVRVVSKANLPPQEHAQFVFDGEKTIKIFKGGAPVHFAVFTDLPLPAGSYRFTINFFADTVAEYNQGGKVWATHPQAAEVRFILNNGGSDWLYAAPGQKNTLTYDFTLTQPATVRLGADFRNRFINNNNGWFLDNWILQQIDTP
jgi:LysM repeat protein